MKKLKLESLVVESFETAAVAKLVGTVVGNAITPTRAPDCKDTVEDYTCGVWCPPSQNPVDTEPCLC